MPTITCERTYQKETPKKDLVDTSNTNLCLYIVNVRDTIINSKIINKNSVMPVILALQKCFLNFMHNESCLAVPYSMQNMNVGHQTDF